MEVEELEVQLDGSRKLTVDLTLNRREAVRLSGPSGSGKTTLLKALALLNPRISGKIMFNGQESGAIPPPVWRAAVCFLPQKPTMLPGSVEDNLKIPAALKITSPGSYSLKRAESLLELLGLPGSIINVEAVRLSGGEAARVALARAMMGNPKVILADEITSQQDESSARLMVGFLNEWRMVEESGLIFVAHQSGIWNNIQYTEINIRDFLAA